MLGHGLPPSVAEASGLEVTFGSCKCQRVCLKRHHRGATRLVTRGTRGTRGSGFPNSFAGMVGAVATKMDTFGEG